MIAAIDVIHERRPDLYREVEIAYRDELYRDMCNAMKNVREFMQAHSPSKNPAPTPENNR